MLLIIRTAQHRYIVRREDVATLRAMTRSGSGDGREDADPSVIAVELGPLIDSSDVSTAQRRHALIIPLRRRNIALLVDAVDTIVDHVDVQPLPQLLRERLHEPWATGVLIIIISTLALQVHQVLFLTLSVFPMCKKYSISEV